MRSSPSADPIFSTSLAALAIGLVAFIAILLAISVTSTARPGSADVVPIVRNGRMLTPNNANAVRHGEQIVVANSPSVPLTILAIGGTPFRADDYRRLSVDAATLPGEIQVALIWVRRDAPGKPFEEPLAVDRGRLVPTRLDGNPEWTGDIVFAALGVKGVAQRPWAVSTLSLERPSTMTSLLDMANDWSRFERWDGRSINVIFGGSDHQRVWLPPIVFAACLAAAFALHVLARKRRLNLSPLLMVVPFVVGWIALDLRWQRNLFMQASETVAQFGGRDWEGRHLAMDDGALFKFVQAAKAALPATPVRVFATSDFEYFRRRAGYHLYPHNVLAYDWADPSILRPGDYVLFFQKADVHWDGAKRELAWSSGPRVHARAVLAERGAGLFEVQPTP